MHRFIDDHAINHFYDAKGARAVRQIVCGFEINRYEIHFRYCPR